MNAWVSVIVLIETHLQGFFHEMVSDAVGTKVLGKSGEGTLSTVSPLRGMENETENSFTSRWIPMSAVWRARNRGTPRDL